MQFLRHKNRRHVSGVTYNHQIRTKCEIKSDTGDSACLMILMLLLRILRAENLHLLKCGEVSKMWIAERRLLHKELLLD